MHVGATVGELWRFEVLLMSPTARLVNIGDRESLILQAAAINSSTLGVFGVAVWSFEAVMTSLWAVLTDIWRHNEPLRRFSTSWTCYRDDSERNMPFWHHRLLSLTDRNQSTSPRQHTSAHAASERSERSGKNFLGVFWSSDPVMTSFSAVLIDIWRQNELWTFEYDSDRRLIVWSCYDVIMSCSDRYMTF